MRRYRKATMILGVIVVILLVVCFLLGHKLDNFYKLEKEVNNYSIELDTNSAEIKYLYDMAHVDDSCILLHQEVFDSKKLLVNDMSSVYRSQLTSKYYSNQVFEGPYDSNGYSLMYVLEDNVRNAYDLVFGPGSGSAITSIRYGIYDLKYNPEMKRFDGYITGGGGWVCDYFDEEIISAIKYRDRIEITTVVWFMFNEKEGIYKDLDGNLKLEFNADGASENIISDFVNTYKDELQTYKYTYKLNDNGFYNYYSVERIKN